MFSKKWGSSSPFVGVARNTLFTYPLSPASQELSLKGEPKIVQGAAEEGSAFLKW